MVVQPVAFNKEGHGMRRSPDWENPCATHRHRLPARAHFHAFAPEEEARAAVGRRSRRTMSLDGQWHFRLLDSPLRVTPDLVSTFQEGWDRVELPHLWQFDGYGRLQYTDEGYPFPVDPPRVISAISTYITPSLIWEIIRAQCLFILSWHFLFISSENWDFFRF